MDQIKHYRI